MRARREEAGTNPPAEITDYQAFCRLRGWEPYASAADPVAQRACAAQYVAWEQERQVWAGARGVAEVDSVTRDAPFDPDSI